MAKILAVDDSMMIRNLVSTVLIQAGHEVVTAADGTEAIKIARDESFDLVLSDINMPEMNGISLVSKLRRLDHFKFTPIIMVTTEGGDYKKKKAKSFGATGWLLKPFDEKRLLAAVNKTLSK